MFQKDPLQISDLIDAVEQFCSERNWNQFHNIKELAIGAVTESSELLEIFRFSDWNQSDDLMKNPRKREAMEDEVADVLFFLLRIAGLYKVDLSQALLKKLEKNALKYPVESSFGSKRKYNEID